MRKLLLGAALTLAAPLAHAAPLFDSAVTADAAIAAPSGATAALAGPGGLVGGLQSGPITVVAPLFGPLQIAVQDLGFVGDVFQALVDGVPVGTTSPVPVGGPDNSAGLFTVTVGAGPHSIDLWDITMSFIGTDSPYGGAVDDSFSPADVALTVSFVPEPASLLLLGAGLLGLGWARRRYTA